MFINCRHCNALVATDPATDLPPERCPRCAGVLRLASTATGAADMATRPAIAVPVTASVEPSAAPTPAPPAGRDQAADMSVAARLVVHDRAPVLDDALPRSADARAAPPPTGRDWETPAQAEAEAPSSSRASPPDGHEGARQDTGRKAAVDEAATKTDPPPRTEPKDAKTPPVAATAAASSPAAAAPVAAAQSPAPQPVAEAPVHAGEDAPAAAPSPPVFGARRGVPVARTLRAWRQPVVLAGLLVLLGVQIVLADRERLAADAQWRPLISGLCGILRCSVAPWREPEAFVLLAREVRPHPQRAGVLRASATFRNDARWPQPWPDLALTLSDLDGRAVAARVFAPHEYLGAAPASPLLAAGQSVDIALDIHEPAAGTVSYAWDLR